MRLELTLVTVAFVGGLLGLVVGSFLSVVAHRVPIGRSVVRPRSACMVCGAQIRSLDNIPVVSWLLLRGRCRDCGTAISARYLIVEATTAALFVAAALVIGVAWVLPAYWWFVAVGVALVLTDIDHKRIPNRILFPGIIVGAVLLTIGAVGDGADAGGGLEPFIRAGAGGAAYFTGLLVLALIARGGFGFGDVKLAILLGMFLAYQSWGVLATGVLLAFLLGGLQAILLLVTGIKGRKDPIPFGPPLIAGALIALAAGQGFVDWYIG